MFKKLDLVDISLLHQTEKYMARATQGIYIHGQMNSNGHF